MGSKHEATEDPRRLVGTRSRFVEKDGRSTGPLKTRIVHRDHRVQFAP
jgi:hypothetical protein